MNRCGDCKHFGKDVEAWSAEADDFVPTGYHECNLINLKRAQQKIPPPLAYAQDASDYRACLIVSADFGCVEWTSSLE